MSLETISTSTIIPFNFSLDYKSICFVGTNAIASSINNSNLGLLYSIDSGQTWRQSNITTGTFKSVYMVGVNAIAGSNSNTGLWWSANSGQTWNQSTSIDSTFPTSSFY